MNGAVPEFHNNIGGAYHIFGKLDKAISHFRRALALNPNFVEAHFNLGKALYVQGDINEAIEQYQRVITIKPDHVVAYNNLASTLYECGKYDQAIVHYQRALSLEPGNSEVFFNLGLVLRAQGHLDEAVTHYRRAVALRPDFAEAHTNIGQALLLSGRFEEGWKEYEWRWKTNQMSGETRDFSAPVWNGEAIGDRVILLHAEQGFGDTLQFCRYVPLLSDSARIVLEVHPPLVRLLSRLRGVLEIVARGDRLPPFDLHCPLLSLPRAFGTTLDSIPSAVPYLSADPTLAASWRERLDRLDGLRVGLVWASNPDSLQDAARQRDRRDKSISPDQLSLLAEVRELSFVSLQKAEAAGPTRKFPAGLVVHDWTDELENFADTAALIDGLDLVISVDTAVAHLAGALGKPVWLMNRFDTDWRWLLNRDDSPWYPLLRQFRQPAPGDWISVIAKVQDALRRLVAGDRDQLRAR
ncbi:MAG: glycosyltransferase family protein [Alphaproteobacteria bacterium]|nr:glycosyltransferase family protein [Alphaproteobacteria bacterium]